MLSFLDRNPTRILVVRPDRVGDVILSTPVYRTLKESFKGCFVGALVSPYTSPLLMNNPYVDVIITDDPSGMKSGDSGFWRKVREIRSFHFDVALLLMPTKRLAYMLFLSGIKYRVGVGHILYEVITMMHGVSRHKYNPLRHESDYMLDLARRIGAAEIHSQPEIFLTAKEKDLALAFLSEKGFSTSKPVACIHPGSGHSSPNWEVGRYAELASLLVKSGMQVLVTGSSAERRFERVFTSITGDAAPRTSFGELSLRELAAVISETDVFVSSSTGPMHIAAAVGTPTVSMFCPLTACSPALWGPIGKAARIVLPAENFCRTKCPGDPHVCTFWKDGEGIEVETVYREVMDVLNETEPQYSKDTSNGDSTGDKR